MAAIPKAVRPGGAVASEKSVDELAVKLVGYRRRPLLVLFYDERSGYMYEEDVDSVYTVLREAKLSRKNPVAGLDFLIHTYGGDPNAGYRIAQVVRDFSKEVVMLVPDHATSAGTLTSLCSQEIRLGAGAYLSPIDITLAGGPEEIELAGIEYFKRFVGDCRNDALEYRSRNGLPPDTDVDSALLVKMVDQLTAIRIGSLYRNSELTGHYAKRLMVDYMFANLPNRKVLADEIASSLLKGLPAHDFVLDYHMCKETRLPVVEMDEDESDLSKRLTDGLGRLSTQGAVCKDLGIRRGDRYKAPHVRFYAANGVPKSRTKR